MPYTLAPKFYLPEPVANEVVRSDLMARLRSAPSRKVTLICAPAGFGKTTLAATWLRDLSATRPPPVSHVAWYALNPADNDFATFVTTFVAAIRHTAPAALPDWIDLDRRPNLPSPEYLASELAGALSLSERLIVALEDYHFITDLAVHRLIAQLLRQMPPNLHLVILTRHDPPLGLARLRAHGDVLDLRAHDMAFSCDEAALLLDSILGESLDPEIVQVLWEQTEGWLVGLRLAALSLQTAADPARFLADFRHHGSRHIADYLMDEVLRGQPAAVEDFLLRTSILDRLHGPLCAAVMGIDGPSGQALLEQVVAHNLLVTPLDDYRGWYRYHGQFQTLLRHRLPGRCSDQDIAALHRRAADWLTGQARIDQALPHYLVAGDAATAARLVEAQAPHLEHWQQWGQLAQWLTLLPAEMVEQRPGLLLARAWLLYARSAWSSIPSLVERAEALLDGSAVAPVDQAAILWGQIHALRASVVFPLTGIEAKIEHGREALRLLPIEYSRARATALNFLARWLNAVGRPEEARSLNEAELGLIQPSDTPYVIRIYYNLCVLEYFAADLDRYQSVACRLRDLAGQAQQPIDSMWAEFILARIHLERNEVDAAFDHLTTLFARPDRASLQALLMGAYLVLPLYAARRLDERGSATLTALRQRLMEAPDEANRLEVEALEAYWAMLSGDLTTATTWAKSVGRQPATEHEWRRGFILVRVLLAQGGPADLAEAVALLEYLLPRYAALGYTPEQTQTLVLLARARWLQGTPDAALVALRQAVDLGYARGYRRVYTEHGPSMGEMLNALAQETCYTEAAGALLLALGSADSAYPPPRLPHPEAGTPMIEPLTPREFDILDGIEQGLSNKEIAYRLKLAPQTVRNHTVSIYAKLCVAGRREAVTRAREMGLLRAPA